MVKIAISTLVDLVSTYGDEAKKLRELIELGSERENSGDISWTSLSSSIVYDTSTSADPNILNKSEDGLLYWLSYLFTTDTPTGYGNCLITASYMANLIKGIQNSELVYSTDGGASDSYAISLSVAPTAYVVGQMFSFYANTANSGACTLNINALGSKAIVDFNNQSLRTGTILSGMLVIVQYDGTSFRMLSDGGLFYNRIIDTPTIYNWDGWISANETWTYASATTFTVSGDVTTKYQKGDKIKLNNTTTKYFYIIATPTYSAPNTTITVSAGSDYSLSNAGGITITANYYSKTDNPQGFPHVFNYSPTRTGFSANPTPTINQFRISGNILTLFIRDVNAGTSNATTYTITLPVVAKTVSDMEWYGFGAVMDNGLAQASPGMGIIASAGTVLSLYKTSAFGAFTNSGTKSIFEITISYLI